jgi:hypothetical protein
LRPAHSRCHQFVTRLPEGFNHFVSSMIAPVASGWSISPGGAYTRWKAPPFHGAHPLRTVESFVKCGQKAASQPSFFKYVRINDGMSCVYLLQVAMALCHSEPATNFS